MPTFFPRLSTGWFLKGKEASNFSSLHFFFLQRVTISRSKSLQISSHYHHFLVIISKNKLVFPAIGKVFLQNVNDFILQIIKNSFVYVFHANILQWFFFFIMNAILRSWDAFSHFRFKTIFNQNSFKLSFVRKVIKNSRPACFCIAS